MGTSQFVKKFNKKTPYGLQELEKIIDATYGSQVKVDIELTKKNFSPSSLGYGAGACPRRWILAFNGAHFIQDFDPVSIDNMQNGTDAHARIQENLMQSDLDIEIEHELICKDPPIHGFVDAIIKDFNGHNIIVEIKTTRSEAFESRRAKMAGPDYQELQLLIYMHLLGEQYGILLYENKNNQSKLIIPVEMNAINQVKVDKAFKWMREVWNASEEGSLPKNPYRSNSRICKDCPVKDWCFIQPTGDIELAPLDYS